VRGTGAECCYLVAEPGEHGVEHTVRAGADIPAFGYSNKYSIVMPLRYNYRLYPSPGQQRALARAFGCARVVFNDALSARRDADAAGLPYPTDAELSAALTAAKKTPEPAWLGGVPRSCSSRP
jgi:Helix-turn-helix domain